MVTVWPRTAKRRRENGAHTLTCTICIKTAKKDHGETRTRNRKGPARGNHRLRHDITPATYFHHITKSTKTTRKLTCNASPTSLSGQPSTDEIEQSSTDIATDTIAMQASVLAAFPQTVQIWRSTSGLVDVAYRHSSDAGFGPGGISANSPNLEVDIGPRGCCLSTQ
jgi:hypothetical protein